MPGTKVFTRFTETPSAASSIFTVGFGEELLGDEGRLEVDGVEALSADEGVGAES